MSRRLARLLARLRRPQPTDINGLTDRDYDDAAAAAAVAMSDTPIFAEMCAVMDAVHGTRQGLAT